MSPPPSLTTPHRSLAAPRATRSQISRASGNAVYPRHGSLLEAFEESARGSLVELAAGAHPVALVEEPVEREVGDGEAASTGLINVRAILREPSLGVKDSRGEVGRRAHSWGVEV